MANPVATDEAKPLQCTSVYALSKKNQEEIALLFGKTYDVPTVAFRYFNIYGSRQALSNPYTGVAAIFASRLMNGKSPLVFEDGEQLRDFVSVHDIVQANLLALESSGGDGMPLNVGSGNPISVRQVATEIASRLGVELPLDITGKYRVGDVRHCFADISRISGALGYRPATQLHDGMSQLVEWLNSQQAHDHTSHAFEQLTGYGLVA
jgi:dTDP-L-rhamnose 4-epimerase